MSHITTLQENRPILQEIFNVKATVGRKKDAHKLQNLEQRRAWEDETDKTTSGDDFSHLKCKINKMETKNEVITTCQWLSQSKRVQFTVIHKPRAPRSTGAYQVRLVLCCFDGIVNWGHSFGSESAFWDGQSQVAVVTDILDFLNEIKSVSNQSLITNLSTSWRQGSETCRQSLLLTDWVS